MSTLNKVLSAYQSIDYVDRLYILHRYVRRCFMRAMNLINTEIFTVNRFSHYLLTDKGFMNLRIADRRSLTPQSWQT